jgi:membrane protein DedA with SNARE-associated domain
VLRHGGFAVFTGRFIPAIRSLVPALLGVAGYDRRKYVLLDTVACASWAAALCLLTMLGSAALGPAADCPACVNHVMLRGGN